MPKITIVYGLCGSGKTYVAQDMADRTGLPFLEQPIGRNLLPVIVQWLRSGNSCIVEEALLFDKRHRDHWTAELRSIPKVDIEWICFEKDLATAKHNLEVRERGEAKRLVGLNKQWE